MSADLISPATFAVVKRNKPVQVGQGPTELGVVQYVGLCGTDVHIFEGQHPRARFPLALGHEVVARLSTGLYEGRLAVLNPLLPCGHCPPCRRGDRSVCAHLKLVGIDSDGGLAGALEVPASMWHVVPEGVSGRDAVLAEPLAVAMHAVRRSSLRSGDLVAVVGAGPIGLLTAVAAREAGAREVLVCEPSAVRRQAAESLGFPLLDSQEPIEDIAARSSGTLADIVFDTAARPEVPPILTASVRPAGQIVVVGAYAGAVSVDLQAVMFKGLSMVGVRVYAPQDIDDALRLLAEGVLDADAVVTAVMPLARVSAAFDRLRGGREVKVLIDCS